MNLDCGYQGEVKVSMIPYVEEIIENFPKEIGTSTVATPTADHLFQVRNPTDAKLLPEEQAMLLIASTRA